MKKKDNVMLKILLSILFVSILVLVGFRTLKSKVAAQEKMFYKQTMDVLIKTSHMEFKFALRDKLLGRASWRVQFRNGCTHFSKYLEMFLVDLENYKKMLGIIIEDTK